MLLLVNILIGFTGVVDGLIESSVEEAVAAGYDGLDENGEQIYSAVRTAPGLMTMEKHTIQYLETRT